MKLKIFSLVLLTFIIVALFYLREETSNLISQENFYFALEILLIFLAYLFLIIFIDFTIKNKLHYSDSEALKNLLKLLFVSFLFFYILFKIRIEGLGIVGGTVFGLVLGLAAQHTLGNLFAGILLIATKVIKPGDKISVLSGSIPVYSLIFPPYKFYSYDYYLPYKGVVEEVGLFFSKIKTEDGLIMRIPNLAFLSGAIVNLTESKKEFLKVFVRTEVPIFADIDKIIEKIDKELKKYTSSRFVLENIFIREINWSVPDKPNYILIIECKIKGFDEDFTRNLIIKTVGKIIKKEIKKLSK